MKRPHVHALAARGIALSPGAGGFQGKLGAPPRWPPASGDSAKITGRRVMVGPYDQTGRQGLPGPGFPCG